MADKKSEQITVIPSSEVTTIPSKEELQAGMRKTLKELDAKLELLSVPIDKPWKVGTFTYIGDDYNGTITPSSCANLNLMIKALISGRRTIKDFNDVKKN